MKQIQATSHAFAAILADGSVVAWGAADRGGDGAAVRDQLKGVKQIQATSHAFAAILADGSVVAWGAADRGGDSAAVRDQLKGVKQIQATSHAFAAILADGSVVAWGAADRGGDSSAVRDQLKGVRQLQSTRGAPPPASCTSTCSAPPGPCADKSTGCEGEENLQGILWPPASRRARRPGALC